MNKFEGVQNDYDSSLLDTFAFIKMDGRGKKSNKTQLTSQIKTYLEETKEQGNLESIIRQFILLIGLENLLPPQYIKFQQALTEGMVFFLSELSLKNLARKIVDQLILPHDVSLGRRICILVSDFPSLQKLGQIICRSPGLDPEFKKDLIDLEDNTNTISYKKIEPIITKELKSINSGCKIVPEPEILAEASVCTVIRAKAFKEGSEHKFPVVLKIVKPAVRKNISKELDLMSRLSRYLDDHRGVWGLEDLKFDTIFNRIRHLLENEINLKLEQENLEKAHIYYDSDNTLKVPEKLSCSTPEMTVMSEVNGTKITDVAPLSDKQRRILAETIARFCILRPFQDLNSESIFHGDPHAGNISYWFDGTRPRVVLYDWGMMGTLNRVERFCLALWISGIAAKSEKAVFYAIDIITKKQISSDKALRSDVQSAIKKVMAKRNGRFNGLISTIEEMIEELLCRGVVFPINLLMYEKVLVTLKGVFEDIDPEFNRDDYVLWAAAWQFLKDIFQMRIHTAVAKEIFSLYRYGFVKFINIQKIIFKMWLNTFRHPPGLRSDPKIQSL